MLFRTGLKLIGPVLKKTSRLKAWLVFIDESGFLMAPLIRRTWSKKGATPILYQRTRSYKRVSAIAAVCVSPEKDRTSMYFRLYKDASIDAGAVVEFLGQLNRQLKAPIVIVWDRLSTHRAKKVKTFLQKHHSVSIFFLPPYAPELNPVENVWSYLKINPLANCAIADLDELSANTRRHTRSLQAKQNLLRSFVRHSPLSLRLK